MGRRRAGRRAPKARGSMEVGRPAALPGVNFTVRSFVRSVAPTFVAKPTSSDVSGYMTFALADVPSATDFSSLFDSYRLDRVDLTFWASFTGTNGNIRLFVTSDFDGGSAPTMDEMAQQRHVEKDLTPFHPSHSFSLRPKVATAVNATSGSALSKVDSGWMDLATTTVTHYGVSYYLMNYSSGNTAVNLYVSKVYHFRCRGVR